jgi:3-mercaptopyruvate sulfurtransferase SseA
VALKLRQHGFTRIRPLAGGLEAWIEAGMPVEDGQPPAGLDPAAGRELIVSP